MRQFPKIADGEMPLEPQIKVNNAMQGRLNITETLTLDANADTTTLDDPIIIPGCHIWLTPETANAKTEGHPYIPAATVTAGQAILHHTNNAQVDRTYRYSVIGG